MAAGHLHYGVLPFIAVIGTPMAVQRPLMWFLSCPAQRLGTVACQRFLHHMQTGWLRQTACLAIVLAAIGMAPIPAARAQELGGAGAVQGTLKDPTGGGMAAVSVG